MKFMSGVLATTSEPFISLPLELATRAGVGRGGAPVMPSRFLASEYWRAVTATLRLRASERTCLKLRLGALRSHPSIRRMVSSALSEDWDSGSGMARASRQGPDVGDNECNLQIPGE